MIKSILLILFLSTAIVYSQNNLDYYLVQAYSNSPAISAYQNMQRINDLQKRLDYSENAGYQVSVTGDVLFAPYFNNNGHLVSTNPSPNAIGYDIGITNGGLYSALINVDKNIFNGSLINSLNELRNTASKTNQQKIIQEKHDLKKQITDQYLKTLRELKLYRTSKEINKNLTKQLELTQNLVSSGYLKPQDYLVLKIELKNEDFNQTELWQSYKSNLNSLNSLCGIKDTQTVYVENLSLKQNSDSINSKFLHQYYLDSLQTAIQQKLFETKYQPQVKVFLNAGLNAVEFNNIDKKFGMSAGLSLSIPILDGNQKDITRQKTILSEKTISDYKNYSIKNIYVQKNSASDKINMYKNNLKNLDEQISDYNDLLKISKRELEKGNISMIEYLTLYKNFIELKKNKIKTEINYQSEINNYNYWNW